MIIQPKKGTRNVNDLFYESEKKRIDMLNREFFHDVELTKKENDVLMWLCGWDNWTIEAIISVFRKVKERETSNMEIQNNFVLNEVFKQNAKVYQTKPVLATKYKPGMETGWLVYMCNKVTKELRASQHEGMVFFDTKQEAWDYINADNPQYAELNGTVIEVPVVYDPPVPVLHRKETDPDKKVGFRDCFQGKYALKSNETEQYDFFILDYHHTTPDTWIIQDVDGSVRIWDEDSPESCNELFFGKEDSYVCEKVGDNTYIEVAV